MLVFRAREEAEAIRFIGSMIPPEATKSRDEAVEAYKLAKFPFMRDEKDNVEKNAMTILENAASKGGFAIDPRKVDFRLARRADPGKGKNKW